MEVLMEHARDHSVINVTAASQPEFVTVTLHNEGCGVALEQLAAIRRSRPDRPHGSAARLFDQAVWVRSWGGDLTVQSELGEGASIQYTLPRFHWGERQPGFAREQIRQ
jgi:signal transduction histidine kinase